MLRAYIARSAARLGEQSIRHTSRRAFSVTASRPAEVTLTVDGKQVSIEGTARTEKDNGERTNN